MRHRLMSNISMKVLVVVIISLSFQKLNAQSVQYAVDNPAWEYYIMDGKNKHYAWARQITPSQLAIGLTEGEGSFVVENDSCVWLRGKSDQQDELVCCFHHEEEAEEYVFSRILDSDKPETAEREVMGVYDPYSGWIYDENHNQLARIEENGDLVDDSSGNVILRLSQTDKFISAFFYLYYYIPQKALLDRIRKTQ